MGILYIFARLVFTVMLVFGSSLMAVALYDHRKGRGSK